MAGTGEPDPQDVSEGGDLFVWDEESKLYFHASSGFYHDPNGGWYFSSRDGLYYKFENGSYVLLQSNEILEDSAKREDVEDQQIDLKGLAKPSTDKTCSSDPFSLDDAENTRPPSEWLEDTLINLYLMGYPNSRSTTDDAEELGSQIRNLPDPKDFADAHESDLSNNNIRLGSYEHGKHLSGEDESEITPHVMLSVPETNGENFQEVGNYDEENWRAQYGQVGESLAESVSGSSVVDLWDWTLIKDSMSRKKHRLMGKLVKKSMNLHPSVPSGGGLLKTASISEVHLDLVRVSSGRIYRLRCPSKAYLASVTKYDASNPTKDWGFPDLSQTVHETVGNEPYSVAGGSALEAYEQSNCGSLFQSLDERDIFLAKGRRIYRDRAAERRKLHGGFGIGLGQENGDKDFKDGLGTCSEVSEESPPGSSCTFATGSYGRRMLESMGWKEGEALGKTQKGLLEPLQAVGNRGSAGLGWVHDRNQPRMNF